MFPFPFRAFFFSLVQPPCIGWRAPYLPDSSSSWRWPRDEEQQRRFCGRAEHPLPVARHWSEEVAMDCGKPKDDQAGNVGPTAEEQQRRRSGRSAVV